MAYKRSYRKKRTFKRKYKKVPKHKRRNRMQKSSLQYSKRKYTKVFDVLRVVSSSSTNIPISHVASVNV